MSTIKSPAATTSLVENERMQDQGQAQAPNPNMVPTVRFGIITQVDEATNKIMAVGQEDDPLGGGYWIPVTQSAEEITRTWGTIRQGMKVMVMAFGTAGIGAIATVLRNENSSLIEDKTENDVARGLFLPFAPGIGIG